MLIHPLTSRLSVLILPHLGPNLLSGSYKAGWSLDNPTKGLCSVATEAAWFVLGGPQSDWTPYVTQDPQGGTHWWLQNGQGDKIDLTQDQYTSVGQTPPYDRGHLGHGTGFMGIRQDPGNVWGFDRKPSKRAQQVLSALLLDWGGVIEVRQHLKSRPHTPK